MNPGPNYPSLLTPSLSILTELTQDSSKVKLKQETADLLPQLSDSTSLFDKLLRESQYLSNFKPQDRLDPVGLTDNLELSDAEDTLSNQAFANYNRKEKSLGELSKKFLTMFGRSEECSISLDSVTQHLGVERRRIYDIINILESLGVIFRKGKNHYQWKGLNAVHKTINKLQKEQLLKSEEKSSPKNGQGNAEESMWEIKPMFQKEKYLSFLSTGFIKLFISWRNVISLEQAATKLTSVSVEDNKLKTKIRRLYDIANVFSVLGIIKKTCLESKKPAFEWVGLSGLDNFIKKLHTSKEERVPSSVNNPMKKSDQDIIKRKSEDFPTKGVQSNELEVPKLREIPIRQNMLENFLVMLLHLCRQEFYNSDESASNECYERLSRLMPSDTTDCVKPRLGLSDLCDYKQTSMMTREEIEDSVIREKKRRLTESILQDRTNGQKEVSGFKRPASSSLSEQDVRIQKKFSPILTTDSVDGSHEKVKKGESKDGTSEGVKIEPS